jgi:hypothetical protein
MSTNPVLVYTDAKKRFDAARRSLDTIARNIQFVAGALIADWTKITAPGVAITGSTVNRLSQNFDKAKWPTGDQMQAAIIECHQAFQALQNAYRAMAPADQTALCPSGPPTP